MFQTRTMQHDRRTVTIVTCDSLDERARRTAKESKPKTGSISGSFYGASTPQDCLDKVRKGPGDSVIRAIDNVLNKVDAAFRDRDAPTWANAVAGAFPNVPAFLQGDVECMRARMPLESDVAPIRLFAAASVSAGVNDHCLQVRGAAIAALAMRLAEVRPLELYVVGTLGCHGSRDTVTVTRLGTAPLSASEIGTALATPLLCRFMDFHEHYTASDGGNAHGSIAWFGGGSGVPPEAAMRTVLGMNEQDVWIGGGHLSQQSEIVSDPVGWVHKQLQVQREAMA